MSHEKDLPGRWNWGEPYLVFGKFSIERCHVFVKLGDLGVSTFDTVLSLLDVLFHLF